MEEALSRLNDYYHIFLQSLPKFLFALLILVSGILISNWLTGILRKKIKQKSQDPLMSNFLSKAFKILLFICILLLTLRIAGLGYIAGALVAAAGASAIVIGFAFKDIAENFLAGIILAFNRPFHVNDTVQIEEVFGKVLAMEFRYTKIATFDGRNVYIPNSDVLTLPVYNYTEDGFFRTDFIVGIAYENDIEEAKEIIRECLSNAEFVVRDEVHTSFVVEHELAASTVNLKVFFWVHTKDFRRNMLESRGKLIQAVKVKLESAGFNLPAEIRELKFYAASDPFKIATNKKVGD